MTMIIKMALAKDDSDCGLSGSHGVCGGGGIGDSLFLHPEFCSVSTWRSPAGKLFAKVTQLAHDRGRI